MLRAESKEQVLFGDDLCVVVKVSRDSICKADTSVADRSETNRAVA